VRERVGDAMRDEMQQALRRHVTEAVRDAMPH